MSEKLGPKFPSFKLGYSLRRISCLDDAFLAILQLEARPVEGQKEKKERQQKNQQQKNKKPKT